MKWEHIPQDTWLILAVASALLWIAFYYGERVMARGRLWFDEDRKAMAINPGNGWRVARLILRVTSDEAETLFRDFLSQPHRDRKERVFAAYWVRICSLQGLSMEDCWKKTAFAAVKHEQGTGRVGFWGTTTINEVGETIRQVYEAKDEAPFATMPCPGAP